MSQIKVMVVDDSAVVRQVVSGLLNADPRIRVIGTAADPLLAMVKMKEQWPDVLLLDIEMPKMDGITFLRKIMQERPTPIIICSTLTEAGAKTTIEALAAGALAIIQKPKLGIKSFLTSASNDLVTAVKAAAQANMGVLRLRASPLPQPPVKLSADAIIPAGAIGAMAQTTERVVAIGTSTGGTQALEAVLGALPLNSPGIVVVQHMPEKFTTAFAARLNDICRITVKEAQDKNRVLPGQVLIAPGGKHLLLRRSGAQYVVEVSDGPLVNRHRPSVDVLFRSVAKCAGSNALGVIMTGMGDYGAAGLLEMRKAGAMTIAQDEPTCVVYGMPKEAVKRGGVERSLSLDQIAREIMQQKYL